LPINRNGIGAAKEKAQPNKRMKPNHARRGTGGFTGWDLLVCVVTAGLAISFYLREMSRPRSRGCCRINCASNLKQIGLAFRMWSNDNGEKFPWEVSRNNGGTLELISSGDALPHFQAISNELNTPKILVCSSDVQRVGNRRSAFDASGGAPAAQILDNANQISYFAGLDANEINPQSLLSGDRNLSTNGTFLSGLVLLASNAPLRWASGLHAPTGYVGLADGSAHRMIAAAVGGQREKDTNRAIRLVFP
jgi:hypothetical protein